MSAWGPVTITVTHTAGGAGTEWVSQEAVVPGPGRLTSVQIRRDASDTVSTSVVPYWVNGDTALSATPADERVLAAAASVTLTAHATTASLDDDIDNPRSFSTITIGGDFTFSGAGTSTTYWTLFGDRA
jgi:hypothetical protein